MRLSKISTVKLNYYNLAELVSRATKNSQGNTKFNYKHFTTNKHSNISASVTVSYRDG